MTCTMRTENGIYNEGDPRLAKIDLAAHLLISNRLCRNYMLQSMNINHAVCTQKARLIFSNVPK